MALRGDRAMGAARRYVTCKTRLDTMRVEESGYPVGPRMAYAILAARGTFKRGMATSAHQHGSSMAMRRRPTPFQQARRCEHHKRIMKEAWR